MSKKKASIGLYVGQRSCGYLPFLCRRQNHLEGLDDGAGHLLLNVEDIVQRATVFLGPHVAG